MKVAPQNIYELYAVVLAYLEADDEVRLVVALNNYVQERLAEVK